MASFTPQYSAAICALKAFLEPGTAYSFSEGGAWSGEERAQRTRGAAAAAHARAQAAPPLSATPRARTTARGLHARQQHVRPHAQGAVGGESWNVLAPL